VFNKEVHYLKKLDTLEKNKEKTETKGQKMTSKESSRLIRNYKKREDSVKESQKIFEEFRTVFLNCVQNRFASGNPLVRNYIEHKTRLFSSVSQINQQLFNDRGILSLPDNIDVYKDRLFQSRIGEISGIQNFDPANGSNIFTSQIITQEKPQRTNLYASMEPIKQIPIVRESQNLDFRKKPIETNIKPPISEPINRPAIIEPVIKNNPIEIQRVSSNNDSGTLKQDDRNVFQDDDPFNFNIIDSLKKPTSSKPESKPMEKSIAINKPENKVLEKASPIITFKSKPSGMKQQDLKESIVQESLNFNSPLKVAPQEPRDDQRSKFNFDFGSFQPIERNNTPLQPKKEEMKPTYVQPVQETSEKMFEPQQSYRNIETPYTNIQQTHQPMQETYQQPINTNNNYQDDYYQNYNQNNNHEYQQTPVQEYGNFDSTENYQDAYQAKDHQYSAYEQQSQYQYQNNNQYPVQNNVQYNNQNNNQYQNQNNNQHHYRIEVDKDVSSDEEYTYY